MEKNGIFWTKRNKKVFFYKVVLNKKKCIFAPPFEIDEHRYLTAAEVVEW